MSTTTTFTTHADVPFPPNPNPSKPKLKAPPGSWDTHFHVFGPPDRFPYAESRRYTPPAAPIEHWMKISRAIGIDRGFVVTPNIHDLDPTVTLDAIERSEGRIRGMIRADSKLTTDDMRKLHGRGIRGLRFPFAKFVARTFDVDVFRTNIARMEPLKWVAEFQIDDEGLVRYADEIGKVPLPVIIDQFAGLQPKDGLDTPGFRILLDLMGRPNVYLKMICPDRYLADGNSFAEITAMAKAVIAKAPDRVVWGSDWPHAYVFEPNQMPDDGWLLDCLLDFAPDEAVRRKILVDNPTRLLDFD